MKLESTSADDSPGNYRCYYYVGVGNISVYAPLRQNYLVSI